jgi:hypothetical protein
VPRTIIERAERESPLQSRADQQSKRDKGLVRLMIATLAQSNFVKAPLKNHALTLVKDF